MPLPLRLTMTTSSSPEVATTRTSSSPSRRAMAMKPFAPGLVVLGERRLLHLAHLGGEGQEPARVEVAGGHDGLDRLVGLSGRRFTTAVPRAVRSFMGTSWARSR